MMVVSPFAGNLLTLNSIYQKWSNIGYIQKIVRHASLDVIPSKLTCLSHKKYNRPFLPLRNSIYVTLFCSLLMIPAAIMFSCCWMFWIIARNMFFRYRWPTGAMYLSQSPNPSRQPHTNWTKASLVDMVSIVAFTRRKRKLSSSHHDT